MKKPKIYRYPRTGSRFSWYVYCGPMQIFRFSCWREALAFVLYPPREW